MPTATTRHTEFFDLNQSEYVSTSFAPAGGGVLYACIAAHRSSGGADPDSLTGFSGTWTKLGASATYGAGLDKMSVWRCTDYTGGSGTLTITFAATQSNCALHVFEVSGASASTPTNTGTNTGSSSTGGSCTVSSPAASSAVYGVIGTFNDNTVDIVPGTAFTEMADVRWATDNTGSDSTRQETEKDETSPGTTVDWTWTTTTLAFGCFAWEEVASGAAVADVGVLQTGPAGQILQGGVF